MPATGFSTDGPDETLEALGGYLGFGRARTGTGASLRALSRRARRKKPRRATRQAGGLEALGVSSLENQGAILRSGG